MTARNARAIPSDGRPLNLALQGGGAHGPFTWVGKFNPEGTFLERLFEAGRRAADDWLNTNYASLGRKATVDVHHLFHGDGYEMDGADMATRRRPAAERFLSRAARYAWKALPRP